jgi:hypothetical protein
VITTTKFAYQLELLLHYKGTGMVSEIVAECISFHPGTNHRHVFSMVKRNPKERNHIWMFKSPPDFDLTAKPL